VSLGGGRTANFCHQGTTSGVQPERIKSAKSLLVRIACPENGQRLREWEEKNTSPAIAGVFLRIPQDVVVKCKKALINHYILLHLFEHLDAYRSIFRSPRKVLLDNLKQLWDNGCVEQIPLTARKWLAQIGKQGGLRGGLSRSRSKGKAARLNGKKGGRPRKEHNSQ
jgi:hypothetical protein